MCIYFESIYNECTAIEKVQPLDSRCEDRRTSATLPGGNPGCTSLGAPDTADKQMQLWQPTNHNTYIYILYRDRDRDRDRSLDIDGWRDKIRIDQIRFNSFQSNLFRFNQI